MPPPEWQIEGILPLGGLVGLYGPPGVGKSFVAIDMALHLAAGKPWQGRATRQGYGLYVSAEGGTGIGKRVNAWLRYHVLTPKDAPIAWLVESISVYADSDDMTRLLDRMTEIEDHPEFIVIDTLARCFDGDENQQEDMGRFIAGVDKLRTEFRSTVCIVHHTRLDGDRERGNTAFRGAADCMLSVERRTGGGGTGMLLKCNKQKDSEEFGIIGLGLLSVPEDESCVIISQATPNQAKLIKASEILHVLRTQGPLTWDEWCEFVVPSLMSRATFGRRVAEFRETGEILKENSKFRVSRETEKALETDVSPLESTT